MNRTSSWVAAVTAVIVYSGALSAAALSEQALSATAGANASPPSEASPQRLDFGGNPCQLASSSAFELVEFSAFDEWHGALTTPIGVDRALVFGTLTGHAEADRGDHATDEQVARAPAEPSRADRFREQRQRLFALGLAVLLNLNAQP